MISPTTPTNLSRATLNVLRSRSSSASASAAVFIDICHRRVRGTYRLGFGFDLADGESGLFDRRVGGMCGGNEASVAVGKEQFGLLHCDRGQDPLNIGLEFR